MKQFLGNRVTLFGGDSRDVLKQFPDDSIDSILTDPPYALVSIVKRFGKEGSAPAKQYEGKSGAYRRASAGFMGQTWDTGEVAFDPEFWVECMRVLKPGGHLLSFGGTRTYHRMACAIEDAGFEIRDMMQWLYGSGFPKSHDIAMAIDKAEKGFPHGGKNSDSPNAGKFKTQATEGKRTEGDKGQHFGAGPGQFMLEQTQKYQRDLCETAAEWKGWGTALKPANEPIVLARKPLSEKTVAANVLKWGTGALNIDGCRIEAGTDHAVNCARTFKSDIWKKSGEGSHEITTEAAVGGRFPANIIHDGSDEVLAHFPESKGQQGNVRGTEKSHTGDANTVCYGEYGRVPFAKRNDSGSAARFFYAAKANKTDRAGSKHPTVKPIKLLRYLARLITPPGGMILDPFAGSGTTGEAAYMEGFEAVLIERQEEYQTDIATRFQNMENVDEHSDAEEEV